MNTAEIRAHIINLEIGSSLFVSNIIAPMADDNERKLAMHIIWDLVDSGHLQATPLDESTEIDISHGSIADYLSGEEAAVYCASGYEVAKGDVSYLFMRVATVAEYQEAAGKSLSREDGDTLREMLKLKNELIAQAHKIGRELAKISRGETGRGCQDD